MPADRARIDGALLLVIAFALLAYAGSFRAVPQFDDHSVVFGDAALTSMHDWWAAMPGIRPLSKLSYAIDHASGVAWSFRLSNLLLHAFNAALVLLLARRLLPAGQGMAAAVCGLLFALHPAHSEAVLLLAARPVLLMTSFLLLSLLAQLSGRRLSSLLAFAAACACRETALMLPLLIVLAELWRGRGLRTALAAARWHAAGALLLLALLLALPKYRELLAFSLALRPPVENQITQLGGWTWLLRQWLWPLALDADPRLPLFAGWSAGWVMLAAGWTGALGMAVRYARRGSTVALALLWFVCALLPAHSLIARIDVANERELYVAGIGFCLLAGHLAQRVREHLPRAAVPLGIGLLVMLAGATLARTTVYWSETAYWEDVLRHSQANPRAWNNLGMALESEHPGRAGEAFDAYTRALALDPAAYKAWFNRERLCAQDASLAARCGELRGRSELR